MNAQDHFERGLELYDQENFKGAIAEWRAALARDPNFRSARFNLGLAFIADNAPELARQEFRAVIELAPADLDARRELVELYLAADQIELAAEQLRAILNIAPRDAQAKALLADLQDDLHSVAEKHFQAGIRLYDDNNRAGAIAEWSSARTLDPNFRNARFNLALAYSENDDTENALTELREVIRIAPDDLEARR